MSPCPWTSRHQPGDLHHPGGDQPLLPLYIWIFISAGTRYGARHLVLASVEAVFAYSLVLTALAVAQHTLEAVFFLLLLVLVPLYQYAMLRRVQQAKHEAERANKARGTSWPS